MQSYKMPLYQMLFDQKVLRGIGQTQFLQNVVHSNAFWPSVSVIKLTSAK